MGNFNRDKRSGGGGNFKQRGGGSRSFGGGRDGGRPQMHDAVCAKCGDDCQVPFRPSGDKPVYCSQCFEDSDGGNRNGGGRSSRNDKSGEQLASLNRKLDRILEILDSSNKKAKTEIAEKSEEPVKKEKSEKKAVSKKTAVEPIKKVSAKKVKKVSKKK